MPDLVPVPPLAGRQAKRPGQPRRNITPDKEYSMTITPRHLRIPNLYWHEIRRRRAQARRLAVLVSLTAACAVSTAAAIITSII